VNRIVFALGLALTSALTLFTPALSAAPAPEAWEIWDKADNSSEAVIDHSLWQAVLDSHLKPSADARNYNAAEQQAYWINVYNAVTVNEVLKYPSKNSILRMGERFFSVGPWDDKVFEVAGEELTLNDIEHRILRPIFKDHRVHYAVNCASIGCPNLGAVAFSGAELETQLANQERDYLNHPRGLTFDKKGRLQLSQIYEWYGSDFAEDEKALVAHLAERHATLGDKLKTYTGDVNYDYDWDLNSAE